MKKTVTWAVAIVLVMSILLSACTPSAPPIETTPQVVKETVVVTKEVPVDVVKEVTKDVEVVKEVEVAPSEYSLTVLNPQGAVKHVSDLAPRLDTLDGKKVAMWLSATADELYAGRGEDLYDEMAKMLKDKFANIEIIPYSELPMKYSPADEVIAAITATEPDAVIVGFGG
jgi:alpha/beta superfamily hydrolase